MRVISIQERLQFQASLLFQLNFRKCGFKSRAATIQMRVQLPRLRYLVFLSPQQLLTHFNKDPQIWSLCSSTPSIVASQQEILSFSSPKGLFLPLRKGFTTPIRQDRTWSILAV